MNRINIWDFKFWSYGLKGQYGHWGCHRKCSCLSWVKWGGGGLGVGYQWWLGPLKKAKTVYEREISHACKAQQYFFCFFSSADLCRHPVLWLLQQLSFQGWTNCSRTAQEVSAVGETLQSGVKRAGNKCLDHETPKKRTMSKWCT